MKILIVEDDPYKYSKVAKLMRELFKSCALEYADNVYGAVNYVRTATPDLIILDMSLPSHPAVAGEGNPVSMPSGGIELILELKILGKQGVPILILTQYPDVEIEYEYYSIEDSAGILKSLYEVEKIAVVHYDNETSFWESETRKILNGNEIFIN